ncbi:MAG: MucR family transcriptional regulator [Rhodospirillales bacterium]|nr:MucR family transcriptional regulator [Rhodospirillales bacterium]
MNDEISEKVEREDLLRMAVDIVAAYLSNNQVATTQIPEVIHSVFGTLTDVEGTPTETKIEAQKPAVPVRKSIMPDYIVCLEDGKKLKMLKRHLQTTYNMSPEEYRTKWGLPSDYPMVAPNYAKQRSEFAKRIGLGRKPGEGPKSRRGKG